jgi:glycosyltransferase involved in cell wall biosynthesis
MIIKFRGDLINELSAKGYNVHVIAPFNTEGGLIKDQLELMDVTCHHAGFYRTGLNPIYDLRLLLRLFVLLIKLKPKYCLSYTSKPVIYGSLAAFFARVPFRYSLITGLGYVFNRKDGALLKKFVSILYLFGLRGNNKVFFQNSDNAATFKDLGIVNDDKIRIVNGSGVNVHLFRVAALPSEARFLMIARLLKDKGVIEYFHAAKIVKKKYPNSNFVLAGYLDISFNSISKQDLADIIESQAIEFVGRLDDVTTQISKASVIVLPSYHEGVPRSILEGMAMGRAVITTDAPGCRSTVSLNKNGILVDVGSIDSLVAAMIRLVKNPRIIKKMGIESRKLILEKFDVREVNKILISEMIL